jgi:hypothetical protein
MPNYGRRGDFTISAFRCRFYVLATVLAADLCSLPDSYYDDDPSFQNLKFKFLGDLEITDIVGSISVYLKKVQTMAEKLGGLLANHVPRPTCGRESYSAPGDR